MPTIGERVKYAIDHMGRGEVHAALEHACNAIDITSQRQYGQNTSSRKLFKDLIKEYFWLIEFMSLGNINLEDTLFSNYPIMEGVRKPILTPDFSDLMYHVVRCSLIHSDSLTEGFSFHKLNILECSKNKITFPESVVWALLSIVIFCPINKNERTEPNYWLGMYENRLVINDFWGDEKTAKRVVSNYPLPKITLTNLSNLLNN